MKLSDRVSNVKASVTLAITAKAKAMKAKGLNVINFAAGEPDFDTPDFIKNEAKQAIDNGKTKYTPSIGTPQLRNTICAELQASQGLTYNIEDIIVSNGAKHSLYNIFQAICNKGDEVIIPSPYWVSYPEMVKLSGANPVIVKFLQKNGFNPNVKLLKSKITKKTKAIILNSPSNPTGTLYDKKSLSQIAEMAVSKNVLIISDEIYRKLIYEGKKYTSIASLNPKINDLTVIVDGVSKTYSMTGWRIGYIASKIPNLIDAIKKIQSHSTSNPCSISQEAARAALSSNESQNSVKMFVSNFEERRNYMVGKLNNINKLFCVKPDGAFYCFCDISKTGMKSLEFANKLLDEEKVAVIPGEAFGWPTHIRLSYATSIDNIKEGLDRVEKFVEGLRIKD